MGRPETSPISPVGSARAAINHKRNLAKEASATAGGKDVDAPIRAVSPGSTTCGDSRAATPVATFVDMPSDSKLPEYASAAGKASNEELQAAVAGLTSPVQTKLLAALALFSTPLAANNVEVACPRNQIDEYARQVCASGVNDVVAALDGVCEKNKKKLADAIVGAALPTSSTQVVETADITKYLAAATTSSESDLRLAFDGLAAAQRKKIGDILANIDSKIGGEAPISAKHSVATAADAPASKFVTRFIAAAVKSASLSEIKAVLAEVPNDGLLKVSDVLSSMKA